MRNNSRIYLYIGIGALVLVLLCVGVFAMVRSGNGEEKNNNSEVQMENNNSNKNNNVDDSSRGKTYEETHEETSNDLIHDSEAQHPAVTPETMVSDQDGQETSDELNADEEEDAVSVAANNYTFHEGSILQWPVSGNIIMNYSMDKMIYFETLDVYKYHPAICIQAEEGTKVVAGATGQVVSVTQEADTGLTVGMRIGSEYIIYYGQLKDCDLKEGDNVNRGEEFATVAAPSKHYSIEGPHLYLRLERNEEPVNPLSYLDFAE